MFFLVYQTNTQQTESLEDLNPRLPSPAIFPPFQTNLANLKVYNSTTKDLFRLSLPLATSLLS